VRFKDACGISDIHSFKMHSADLNFNLAHIPNLPPVLPVFTLLAHLFLSQYRACNPQYQKAKETGHNTDTKTLVYSATVVSGVAP
jgi:hypothetical protein